MVFGKLPRRRLVGLGTAAASHVDSARYNDGGDAGGAGEIDETAGLR